eukprot:scaffold162_cov176-Amphora_coffeaeformis.AAC.53
MENLACNDGLHLLRTQQDNQEDRLSMAIARVEKNKEYCTRIHKEDLTCAFLQIPLNRGLHIELRRECQNDGCPAERGKSRVE